MMRKLFLMILAVISLNCQVRAEDKDGRPDTYNYNRAMEAIGNDNFDEAQDYLNKEVGENPKNGYAFSWIAMIRLRQEEYGRALTAADKAVRYLPKKDAEYTSFTYATRADIYLNLNDTLRALDDYAAAIKIRPEASSSYERRAQIYYEQKKYDLADADYRKLISLDQGDVMGYMGIGRNRIAQKRWDEAIEQFDYVAKLHSDYSSAYAFRAESYMGKKNWDKATDDILTALKIDSNTKAFYMLYNMEDIPFAKMKAKLQIQSAKEPNADKWLYYLGVMHERKELYAQAVKFYEEANKRDLSAYTLHRIANCYNSLGQYEKCMNAIDAALAMSPDSKSLLSLKANTFYEQGNIREAIEQWDSILVKYPDYDWAYYRRGWFKEGIGDVEGAIEDFTMAITLDPEYVYSYESRANVYAKQGKADLAKADYEKIIELEPTPDDYQVSMYAYQALGNIEKAVEIMDTIIARDPTRAGAYYEAACLYSRMRQTDKALDYLEKSLSMGYKRFAHIAIDCDMDNLRDLPRFREMIKSYREKAETETEVGQQKSDSSGREKATEIPFTKEDGICKVKCNINGLPLHFVFDTGASTVSLSMVEATFMMKNGFLSEKDVVGSQHFLDANGNVSVGTVINLRKVDFGGLELTNVRASVVRNQKAPLLLGQSVLGRLGKIEIDNSKHVLKISRQ